MDGIDKYTVLMLHFDGVNVATSTIDSSASGHAITFYDDAQLDTSWKFAGTASLLLDGVGDGLSAPDHADWHFGTAPFTIDMRIKTTNVTSNHYLYSQMLHNDNNNKIQLQVYNGTIRFVAVSGGVILANYFTGDVVNINTAYHIELARSGTNIYVFLNGVSQALTESTAIGTNAMPDIAAMATIGWRDYDTGEGYYVNWKDEFRISKGIARHTSGFTPPAGAYTTFVPRISVV